MAKTSAIILASLLVVVSMTLWPRAALAWDPPLCWDNFLATCNVEGMRFLPNNGGVAMDASCNNNAGAFTQSSIRLDMQVVNSHGTIECVECKNPTAFGPTHDCDFSRSWQDITLSPNGILAADCNKGDAQNTFQHTTVDLNACLGNDLGSLIWNQCLRERHDNIRSTTNSTSTTPSL